MPSVVAIALIASCLDVSSAWITDFLWKLTGNPVEAGADDAVGRFQDRTAAPSGHNETRYQLELKDNEIRRLRRQLETQSNEFQADLQLRNTELESLRRQLENARTEPNVSKDDATNRS